MAIRKSRGITVMGFRWFHANKVLEATNEKAYPPFHYVHFFFPTFVLCTMHVFLFVFKMQTTRDNVAMIGLGRI